jgi:N-methylhydantoinase A/oxoprolinase/acetone carboxylase beta subunit
MDTTFVQRSAIASDAVVLGPAVITESTATTVVPPGWNANRDEMGNLWLTRP